MNHPRLIVSFTSYPARISAVPHVLESLYAQTMHPDRILLWLASEQFPRGMAELPKNLVDDAAAGKFELRWCEDLGSHKKYFFAMQEFPDDIIVTVDDDGYYGPDMLRGLYESYLRFPHAISANCVSLLLFEKDGTLKPCSRWIFSFQMLTNTPSLQLMPIGDSGILYPPHAVDKRAFDAVNVRKYCRVGEAMFNDDAWLKIHSVLADVPVVCVDGGFLQRTTLPGSQTASLRKLLKGKVDLVERETEMWQSLCQRYKGELPQRLLEIYESPTCLRDEGETVLCNAVARMERLAAQPIRIQQSRAWEDGVFSAVQLSAMEINCQLSMGLPRSQVDSCVGKMQTVLRGIQGVERLVNRSLVVGAIVEHKAVLCSKLYEEKFRNPWEYRQMLSNWQEFFCTHPDCPEKYLDGFEKFAEYFRLFVDEMRERNCTPNEITVCDEILKKRRRKLPLNIRVRQWRRDLKARIKHIMN